MFGFLSRFRSYEVNRLNRELHVTQWQNKKLQRKLIRAAQQLDEMADADTTDMANHRLLHDMAIVLRSKEDSP